MFGDFAIDDVGSYSLERPERRGFVRAHEAAISDHIGGKDSSQTAFHGERLTRYIVKS